VKSDIGESAVENVNNHQGRTFPGTRLGASYLCEEKSRNHHFAGPQGEDASVASAMGSGSMWQGNYTVYFRNLS